MVRILYQAKADPVLTPGQRPEQVTESRWHQPLSEPTRLRALTTAAVVASGLSWSGFTPAPPPETVTVDKWQRPLSEPTLPRGPTGAQQAPSAVLVKASPFIEAVTLDRWLQRLAEPVCAPLRLAAGAQPALAFVKASPFEESVTPSRWLLPLAEPVRSRPALATPAQQAAWLAKAAPFTETVSLDRWQIPLAEPQRQPARLGAGCQPFFALVKAAPFAESVSADRWALAPSQPTRAIPTVHPAAAVWGAYTPPTGETVTLDKWWADLSGPQRRPLPVGWQAFAAHVQAAPFGETIDVAKWFTPLGEPAVKSRPGLTAAQQRWLAFAQPEDVTVSRWLLPLAEPARARPALLAAVQPAAWLIKGAPFTEAVSPDRWLLSLSEPRRQPLGLDARLQQFLTRWAYPLPNLDAPAWVSVIYPERVPGRLFPAAHQQAIAFVKASPFAEAVTADRWMQAPTQPVRRIHAAAGLLPAATAPALPSVGGPDRWLQAFGIPAGRPPRERAPGDCVAPTVVIEPITLDKWHAWAAVPVYASRRPAEGAVATPAIEPSVAAWVRGFDQPPRGRLAAPWLVDSVAGPASPVVAAISGWAQPLALPVLRVPRPFTGESWPPYFVAGPLDLNSIEWFSALSLPWFPWPTAFWMPSTFDWTAAATKDRAIGRSDDGAITIFGGSDGLSDSRVADASAAARGGTATATARISNATASPRGTTGTAEPRT